MGVFSVTDVARREGALQRFSGRHLGIVFVLLAIALTNKENRVLGRLLDKTLPPTYCCSRVH